eukprot:CAMPEP_0117753854 /NCGR_PEP_ID=MMETSP0947-20121206/12490_1 /TAXON_ID=44440 /ORGANISM="Chattonella subsalsa, Strain CCMP2191" /LENGTH=69 /DNA_ID=CAMNT_0005572849 /DNA_START=243 /DNA_END=452 /DNA_ORIENTATION=+
MEEKEAELKRKYGAQIQRNRERNENISRFFQDAMLKGDPEAERKMQEVLRAGKAKMKRSDVREDPKTDL